MQSKSGIPGLDAVLHGGFPEGRTTIVVAGPGGGNAANPVGTVYVAAARRGGPTLEERHVFPGSRDEVRLAAVGAAVRLLKRVLDGE